jgi:hypothetical protein
MAIVRSSPKHGTKSNQLLLFIAEHFKVLSFRIL